VNWNPFGHLYVVASIPYHNQPPTGLVGGASGHGKTTSENGKKVSQQIKTQGHLGLTCAWFNACQIPTFIRSAESCLVTKAC